MPTWLRRTRAALTLGLAWAITWAPVGVLVSFVVDPDGSMDEPWLLMFGIPGFLGGVLFSAILALAERHRSVRELSLPRVAAWGALSGLTVASLPFVLGSPTSDTPLWALYGVVAGSITTLCTTSATGTVAIARRAQARELPPGDVSPAQLRD